MKALPNLAVAIRIVFKGYQCLLHPHTQADWPILSSTVPQKLGA